MQGSNVSRMKIIGQNSLDMDLFGGILNNIMLEAQKPLLVLDLRTEDNIPTPATACVPISAQ